MEVPPQLCLHAEYTSITQLKDAVSQYEHHNLCKLYKRRSRTIASTLKRTPKKAFNEAICFTELVICCIHGGKKNFQSRSTGKRPNQTTFQKECPFIITIKASKDGQKLVVTGFQENHNHKYHTLSKESCSPISSEKMEAVEDNFIGDHFLFNNTDSLGIEDDQEIDYNQENINSMPSKEEPVEENKGVISKRSQRKDKGKTRFTAYLLWARDMRPVLSKKNPNLNFCDLNKKLGELWKQVSTNQKYIYKRKAKVANENLRKGRTEEDVPEKKTGPGNPISKRLKTSHMEDSVNGKPQDPGPVQVLEIDNNCTNGTVLYMDNKQNSQEEVDISESGEEDSHDEPCGAIKCKQPSGENLDWVQCDGCEAWFHYACVGMMPSDALEEDQEYMCMECTNHVTLPKIPGDNSCPLCGLIYENKPILKIHIETHKSEPRYTCIDCGKGFLRSCHLVVHQRIHTGERPYVCVVCEQTFISASHLHIHRQDKHSVKKDREWGPSAVSDFWSSPRNREVLLQVKSRELDLKAAAAKLRYSYRFCYSRYKEEFGNILHNTPGKRKKEIQDFWNNPLAKQTLLRVKEKEIGMKTAAEELKCTYEFTYARYREVYGKIRKPNFVNNQEISSHDMNENGATSSGSLEEDSPGKLIIKTDVNNETVNGSEDEQFHMDPYQQTQELEDGENNDEHSMVDRGHCSGDDSNLESGKKIVKMDFDDNVAETDTRYNQNQRSPIFRAYRNTIDIDVVNSDDQDSATVVTHIENEPEAHAFGNDMIYHTYVTATAAPIKNKSNEATEEFKQLKSWESSDTIANEIEESDTDYSYKEQSDVELDIEYICTHLNSLPCRPGGKCYCNIDFSNHVPKYIFDLFKIIPQNNTIIIVDGDKIVYV